MAARTLHESVIVGVKRFISQQLLLELKIKKDQQRQWVEQRASKPLDEMDAEDWLAMLDTLKREAG